MQEDRYLFSAHADERLRERGITSWQVVDGLSRGRLIREREDATPHPVAEVEQELIDASRIKAVWGYARSRGVALLITVHFLDP